MRPRLVFRAEDTVTVRCEHLKCDVFVDPSRGPVSDVELIRLVKKYHDLTFRKIR